MKAQIAADGHRGSQRHTGPNQSPWTAQRVQREAHRQRDQTQLKIVVVNRPRTEPVMRGIDEYAEHEAGQRPCPVTHMPRARIQAAKNDKYTQGRPG